MDFLRISVSGKKKRYIDETYNLDLSYITPRVIAMAYPASGLDTIYRNDIKKVAEFLNEKHESNYYVYNLSGKKFDNNHFQNKVKEWQWIDHHAPPIDLLFKICQEINECLSEKSENIVAINCMAGKGRTGTIICCYLLFCGRFNTADEAFYYFSKKRFSDGEGVTQPSQKRYVYYFERLLKEKINMPFYISISDISINKIPTKKQNSLRPYFEIYLENSDKAFKLTNYLFQNVIYSSNNHDYIRINDNDFKFHFCGDITINIYNNQIIKNKLLGRISFNSAFLDYDQEEIKFKLVEIDPDSLFTNKIIHKDFEIKIKFQRFCKCDNRLCSVNICNICSNFVSKDLSAWILIQKIIENRKPNTEIGKKLLFADEPEDVEENLKAYWREVEEKGIKKNNDCLNNSREGDCSIF